MNCELDLQKVVDEWGYNATLLALFTMLLKTRREESDPNVMDAFDQAAARCKTAAGLLNAVGI